MIDDHHYKERNRNTFANNWMYFSSRVLLFKALYICSVWSRLQASGRFHQFAMSEKKSDALYTATFCKAIKQQIGTLLHLMCIKKIKNKVCLGAFVCVRVDMNHSERSGLLEGRRNRGDRGDELHFRTIFLQTPRVVLNCVNLGVRTSQRGTSTGA